MIGLHADRETSLGKLAIVRYPTGRQYMGRVVGYSSNAAMLEFEVLDKDGVTSICDRTVLWERIEVVYENDGFFLEG